MSDLTKKKVFIIATTTYAVDMFILPALEKLSQNFDVTVVTNCNDLEHYSAINARTINIPFSRKPSILRDLTTLVQLTILFQSQKPDLVHSFAPKTGLLSSIASYLSRIKCRCHTFTGQVWATKSGLPRWILKWLDFLVIRLNTNVLCDSKSQQEFLNTEFGDAYRPGVIGDGSLGGVNIAKYSRTYESKIQRQKELKVYGKTVFCYLARKTKDKGAFDVLRSFAKHVGENVDSVLLYLGPVEEELPEALRQIKVDLGDSIIDIPQHVNDLDYLISSDILLLPSYREGFGSVVIKAASMGIPTIGYDIYGLSDSVSESNGMLVAVGNEDQFVDAMKIMLEKIENNSNSVDNDCRAWASRFSEDLFSEGWLEFHLKATGTSLKTSM